MSSFLLTVGQVRVKASTDLSDDVAEPLGEELSDEINAGLHAIVARLKEKYASKPGYGLTFEVS